MTKEQPSIEYLAIDKEKRLELSLKSLSKTKEDLNQNIKILRDWLETQKHLPEVPDDGMIANFLFMNKFSIENAKQKIDMYYSIRSLLPELFQDKNPRLPHMQQLWNDSYVVTFPKVTDEGYRVSYLKYLKSVDMDPHVFFAHSNNMTEIRVHEDIGIGEVVIYDLETFNMKQALTLTPLVFKKWAVILEKVFNNMIKQIHYVNTNPYCDSILSIVKAVLKPKLVSRIHIHAKPEDLKNFIPLRVLPKDLGGEELSLKELNDIWRKKVETYQARYDYLDSMQVKEELRPKPLVNDDILGFHGNFKQLNVD